MHNLVYRILLCCMLTECLRHTHGHARPHMDSHVMCHARVAAVVAVVFASSHTNHGTCTTSTTERRCARMRRNMRRRMGRSGRRRGRRRWRIRSSKAATHGATTTSRIRRDSVERYRDASCCAFACSSPSLLRQRATSRTGEDVPLLISADAPAASTPTLITQAARPQHINLFDNIDVSTREAEAERTKRDEKMVAELKQQKKDQPDTFFARSNLDEAVGGRGMSVMCVCHGVISVVPSLRMSGWCTSSIPCSTCL